MMSDRFEEAFSSFLDSETYEELVSALFPIARAAFLAGWQAAGGEERENTGSSGSLDGREAH